jgi:hypothetical protein
VLSKSSLPASSNNSASVRRWWFSSRFQIGAVSVIVKKSFCLGAYRE